jgi:hypothetical protein
VIITWSWVISSLHRHERVSRERGRVARQDTCGQDVPRCHDAIAGNTKAMPRLIITLLACLILGGASSIRAAPPAPTRVPTLRVVDLNVGEAQEVTLAGGLKVEVKLLDLQEKRDPINNSVRLARVNVQVDGQRVTLASGNYRLPALAGRAQIDCSITKGCHLNSGNDAWGLVKDARLRLWPSGSETPTGEFGPTFSRSGSVLFQIRAPRRCAPARWQAAA